MFSVAGTRWRHKSARSRFGRPQDALCAMEGAHQKSCAIIASSGAISGLKMNVLIIGGGGREHALAWKAAQSPDVDKVYVAPGNAGTATEAKVDNIPLAPTDTPGLIAFARGHAVSLTIVGPEAPLVSGIADAFTDAGLRCFGPSGNAARLEGSKSFSKAFLRRHGIPTAEYESFTDPGAALDYIGSRSLPIVVKADGLAAGKGVIVAQTHAEAGRAVNDMLSAGKFGAAGQRVVVEDFIAGEEASFIVMSDGENVIPLASSQDHKARDNGDAGPNTGGMGAYSPASIMDEDLHDKIMQRVIEPAVTGMRAEGNPYMGFLYAGLMIDANGDPEVLEFNCRLGDPETQPVMMRLQGDLPALCDMALTRRLHPDAVSWDPRAAVGVVMASSGYPEGATRDKKITGLERVNESVKVFHAGTRQAAGEILTNGGRVLCITALADDVTSARNKAYEAVAAIDCEALFFRTDIGYRAVVREAAPGYMRPYR